MFRRRYSTKTIKTYVYCVNRFLERNHKDVRKYSKKDVKEFLYEISDKGFSGSTLNLHLQSLKFMMENVLHKRGYIKIKFSKDKNKKRFPDALSREEVIKLFNSIGNKKHLLMAKLIYGGGLRVGEVLNLKVGDLDLDNCCGKVEKGKGNKDRFFMIPGSIKDDLNDHIKNEGLSSDSFVFVGRRGEMSIGSVQEFLKKASKKAKIKHVHPHMLRHSFATHLIENGAGVSSVQSLLGHKSCETTMVYVHMSKPRTFNITSPLDKLN